MTNQYCRVNEALVLGTTEQHQAVAATTVAAVSQHTTCPDCPLIPSQSCKNQVNLTLTVVPQANM